MRVKNLNDEELREAIRVVNTRFGTSIVFANGPTQSGRYLHFALRLNSSHDPFHRRGHYHDRRLVALCWHGFKAVMQEVFTRRPDAIFKTSIATWTGIVDFEDKHEDSYFRNAGSQIYPREYGTMCDCDEGPNYPFPSDAYFAKLDAARVRQDTARARLDDARGIVTLSPIVALSPSNFSPVGQEWQPTIDESRWHEYNQKMNELFRPKEG